MSDNDDFNYYGDSGDMNLFQTNYSEESVSDSEVDLENQYYTAKGVKEKDCKEALSVFQKVLDNEEGNKGEWGFKALKQMIKINFSLNDLDEMMKRYKQLLTYVSNAVTKNQAEKAINAILESIGSTRQMDKIKEFYETTIDVLKETKNDRLWFKIKLKFGNLCFETLDFPRVEKIVKELHESCKNIDGTVDRRKSSQLLEVYALEIQLYTEQKMDKALKNVYEHCFRIRSTITHPFTMAVIRECGGKMHLRKEEYDKAYSDFFEAFKNFDESSSKRRYLALKYLILATMLMKSDINPFDSQEAQPYRNEPELEAFRGLINAYQDNDLKNFEKIYNANRNSLVDDLFIEEQMNNLLKSIRKQALLKLVKPYQKVHIPFISEELNISDTETELLLVDCILDELIDGRIDQINKILEIDVTSNWSDRYDAIYLWAKKIKRLHKRIVKQLMYVNRGSSSASNANNSNRKRDYNTISEDKDPHFSQKKQG